MYSLERDFNGKGGFQAYWLNIYGLAQVFRKDLGKKPKQAAVDHDAEWKIRNYGNYKPFESYDDCIELLVHNVLKLGAGRSSEVSICIVFCERKIICHY